MLSFTGGEKCKANSVIENSKIFLTFVDIDLHVRAVHKEL